jgi:hypothetical protein
MIVAVLLAKSYTMRRLTSSVTRFPALQYIVVSTGAIWATKNLVSKLSAEERAGIEYGITRRGEGKQEHFVVSSYSQLGTLVDLSSERYEKLRDITTLAITEIRSVRLGALPLAQA